MEFFHTFELSFALIIGAQDGKKARGEKDSPPQRPSSKKKRTADSACFSLGEAERRFLFGMERAITVDLAEGRGSVIIRGGRIRAIAAMSSARQESGRSDARIDEAAPGVIGADVALLVDFVLGGLFFFAFLASPARDVVELPVGEFVLRGMKIGEGRRAQKRNGLHSSKS